MAMPSTMQIAMTTHSGQETFRNSRLTMAGSEFCTRKTSVSAAMTIAMMRPGVAHDAPPGSFLLHAPLRFLHRISW